ncbi:hypothetical protein RMSM_07056, partial [Rhodopirellula maiorica SM1]
MFGLPNTIRNIRAFSQKQFARREERNREAKRRKTRRRLYAELCEERILLA